MTDQPNEAEFVQDDSEDPDVPDLSEEADNEPDDNAEFVVETTQDPEGTEVPDVNKHEDEED